MVIAFEKREPENMYEERQNTEETKLGEYYEQEHMGIQETEKQSRRLQSKCNPWEATLVIVANVAKRSNICRYTSKLETLVIT